MIRWLLIGLFAGFIVVNAPVSAAEFPEEWTACTFTADCSVAHGACGASFGVNSRYKDEAEATMCGNQNCSEGCDAALLPAQTAICDKEQCSTDYANGQPKTPNVN